jgi:lycopene beta-cyclase
LREERGLIPMTTYPFATQCGPRVHAVGAAAGAIRPSSGYAFTRIQGHVSRIAEAFAARRPLPRSVAPARFRLLDKIFLTALQSRPHGSEEMFLSLARAVPADVMARFMTDVSSGRDEAQILSALPKRHMIGAALVTATSSASQSTR